MRLQQSVKKRYMPVLVLTKLQIRISILKKIQVLEQQFLKFLPVNLFIWDSIWDLQKELPL